jgi:hypothetical protein
VAYAARLRSGNVSNDQRMDLLEEDADSKVRNRRQTSSGTGRRWPEGDRSRNAGIHAAADVMVS